MIGGDEADARGHYHECTRCAHHRNLVRDRGREARHLPRARPPGVVTRPVRNADTAVGRVLKHRPGPMFQDATHSGIRVPYRPGHYAWRPGPGQMAGFPAAITHEVAMVRAAGALVIVTARIRFVASDHQAWMPPW